ncbi:MAG: universal stress protein [Deltaproteobacteria bacterium]|nr:universal stress protein [Deltaproteobacteria bacterium]MBW2071346.1 universal stress protein [Deltaproteobacteria bacterium]
MRILCAVDENPYSEQAVRETARLAMNTWANVTILGVHPDSHIVAKTGEHDAGIFQTLRRFREVFLSYFQEPGSPYNTERCGYRFVPMSNTVLEDLYVCESSRKELKVRLRAGNMVRAILAEAADGASDLVVIGCDHKHGCGWATDSSLPRKVVNGAPCSALVVSSEQEITEVICCLDQESVSQASLEMINQMVTTYQARLKIVGLSKGMALQAEVDKSMHFILEYYVARDLKPLISMVDPTQLESFIAQENQQALMALVMGQRSTLAKIFSRKKVDKLVQANRSSVLILR